MRENEAKLLYDYEQYLSFDYYEMSDEVKAMTDEEVDEEFYEIMMKDVMTPEEIERDRREVMEVRKKRSQ